MNILNYTLNMSNDMNTKNQLQKLKKEDNRVHQSNCNVLNFSLEQVSENNLIFYLTLNFFLVVLYLRDSSSDSLKLLKFSIFYF